MPLRFKPTSRATGLPLRAMITSSPASTFASSFDRCVFASCTLTVAITDSFNTNLANNIANLKPCQAKPPPQSLRAAVRRYLEPRL